MERVLREGAFEGETHIVTGAAQGIGNQVAQTLAIHGACVVMVDLDPRAGVGGHPVRECAASRHCPAHACTRQLAC